MISVLVHWRALQTSHADLSMMDYIASCYGASRLVVTPSDVPVLPDSVFPSLASAIEAKGSDARFVYLVPKSSVPFGRDHTLLQDYVHPESVVYVIGHDDVGLDLDECDEAYGDFVSIDTDTAAGPDHPMWGFQCAVIVLYDRFLKKKQSE